MNRRHFTSLAAASLLTSNLWASRADRSSGKFYIALVADPHIIDEFYVKGSENGVEDNESILVTTPRLISARDLINSLNPQIEQVFLIGDYFHNYPSTDYDFYFQHKTRLDNAKDITDGFKAPVHLGWGNHDYDVHRVPREMSHRLFKAKFNTDPYTAMDYKGVKFVHLNNFLGTTQDNTAKDFNPAIGSFGEEQLHWFEAQLAERKPTYVFVHYPLMQTRATEFQDYGLQPILQKHKDTIQLVVSGHVHKWIDFAHTYGPQHYTMAATRYDPSLVEWSTHYSQPYRG
jgi:hypothetical protein